ncbi:unnamed protein product [Durusdinium trenchii]|uniref:Uncharacterized protein n=1 Tax=Durusdinium trenchii TaxID=1381693 RepID=A0ABP0RE11_9DINO
MLVFSALTIPVLGLLTSPFLFGIACLLFLAPAVCRARSLTEPILYPATTLMPTRASLLGLDRESQPARIFYTFSLSIRVATSFVPMVTREDGWIFKPRSTETKYEIVRCCEQTYWEAKSACEHLWSEHRSCYEHGYQIWDGRYSYRSYYGYGERLANDNDVLDRCNQLLEDPDCSRRMWKVLPFCSIMSQLPPYLLCKLTDGSFRHRLFDYVRCKLWAEESPLLDSNYCETATRVFQIGQIPSLGISAFSLTLNIVNLSPVLAVVLLMISCCVSRTRNDVDVAVRVAVDDEVQRLQEELEKNKTAQLSTFAYVLLRVDLVLVSMDMFGDIVAVFTWISTGHVWFGIFQILVILRGVPSIVLLQREQGLVKEVRDSLKANTLTDGLYNLMLQEKTIEGVLTSLLLAYGTMHTFDSDLAFSLVMAKWALSIRSVTNGCFIQFHLAPCDVQTRPFLDTLPSWPLGRRYHVDTE